MQRPSGRCIHLQEGVRIVSMHTAESFDELTHEYLSRFLDLRAHRKLGRLWPMQNAYYLAITVDGSDPDLAEPMSAEAVRRRIDYWYPRTDVFQRRGPGIADLLPRERRLSLHFR